MFFVEQQFPYGFFHINNRYIFNVEAQILKKQIRFLALGCSTLMLGATLTGCGSEKDIVTTPRTDKYATQTRMSNLEYAIYMSKQCSVYTTQIMTRMKAIKNATQSYYSAESDLAKRSLTVMQETRDEVASIYPALGKEDDRKATLEVMDVAIQDMKNYLNSLQKNEDVQQYIPVFENDFNQITGRASLYHQ